MPNSEKHPENGGWIPDPASEETETIMESQNLPEDDRDEVRRFAEFLRRRKAFRQGELLPPAPAGMKARLLGQDGK